MRIWMALFGLLVACDDASESACLTAPATDCAPLYEPTFTNIYNRTLVQSCAVGGGACHGANSATSTFVLVDEASAYDAVMQHVTPNDVACSPLSTRLSGVGGDRMPPGGGLDAGAICAIRQWIEGGAEE